MNYRDKLKESQGDNQSFPKLIPDLFIEVKDNNGVPSFSFWDKDLEKRKYNPKPIVGVLIGKCIAASIYDDQLGPKGGTYKSSYYLNNNNQIVLFGNGGKIEVKGTIEDLERFANGCTGNLSKKQVLLVLTDNGLMAVSTNLTLSIGQLSSIGTDVFLDKNIILTPTLYNPDDIEISSKTKKYLGKFAATNKPKYASISIGGNIDDTMQGLSEAADMFIEWRNHINKGGDVIVEINEDIHEHSIDDIPPEDDLPF